MFKLIKKIIYYFFYKIVQTIITDKIIYNQKKINKVNYFLKK